MAVRADWKCSGQMGYKKVKSSKILLYSLPMRKPLQPCMAVFQLHTLNFVDGTAYANNPAHFIMGWPVCNLVEWCANWSRIQNWAVTYVTGYGKTNHSRHFVETEINTPSERTFIADHNGALIFSIGLSYAKLWAFECEQYASWFWSHAVLIMHVNSEHVGLPVQYAVEQ